MSEPLKAPFPWFGGKSRVAGLVWSRFGDVANYVEPFAGSLAVLLGRKTPPRVETVNDLDCYLSNFWRAVASDPEAVAEFAYWPVNEADLTARHQWLIEQVEFRDRMLREPYYYDARIAGFWIWGVSQWIGQGWCDLKTRSRQIPRLSAAGQGINSTRRVYRKIPEIRNAGSGINRKSVWRKLPYLSSGGMGVNVSKQIPYLNSANGCGINREPDTRLVDMFYPLLERLRRVRVCCGDWTRVMTHARKAPANLGVTGLFLDPPYTLDGRSTVYSEDGEHAAEVAAWARQYGSTPGLRIALCGYEGDVDLPASWEKIAWKATGGYGSRTAEGRGRDNSERERIWFSPECVKPQPGLFDEPEPEGEDEPDPEDDELLEELEDLEDEQIN